MLDSDTVAEAVWSSGRVSVLSKLAHRPLTPRPQPQPEEVLNEAVVEPSGGYPSPCPGCCIAASGGVRPRGDSHTYSRADRHRHSYAGAYPHAGPYRNSNGATGRHADPGPYSYAGPYSHPHANFEAG